MNQQANYGIEHWAQGLNSANVGVQRSLDQYVHFSNVLEQLRALAADPTAEVGPLPVEKSTMAGSDGQVLEFEVPLDTQKHVAAQWVTIYEDRLANAQQALIEAWTAVDNVNTGVKDLLAAARNASAQTARPSQQPQQTQPQPQTAPPHPTSR